MLVVKKHSGLITKELLKFSRGISGEPSPALSALTWQSLQRLETLGSLCCDFSYVASFGYTSL